MSSPFTGAGKLRPIQPGDPVGSQVVDQPILVLARRVAALEAMLQQQSSSSANALIIYNVPTDGQVGVNDVVYYNPSTGLYGQALATVTLLNGTFTANPTALSIGVAVAVNGQTANVQVGGIGTWSSLTQPAGMMQAGEVFLPGAPYYLSATQAGKLTRFPPMMRVQVILTTAINFIVAPLPSIPEAIENNYTVPMGMRPIGSIRALPPDYTKNIIVGFDALENTTTGWQSTAKNANALLQNFGYMVADASFSAMPAAGAIYVEVDIDTGGGIAVYSAPTLEDLVTGGADVFNTQVAAALTAGNYTQVRNYSVLDQNGMSLGTLSFKFVTYDIANSRKVIFKVPDSFQGWKMIYAPVNPIAVPVIVDKVIQSITMQEHGIGFTTPPAVSIADLGGGSNAQLTAVLDAYGGVSSVIVNNGGTGYDANSTVVFDTNLSAVNVDGGGDGAAVFVTAAGGVITAATVISAGSNYGSPPSLIVTDSGSGRGAILQPIMQNGQLIGVTIVDGGSGYTSAISPLSPLVQVVPSSFGYTTAPTLIETTDNPVTPATISVHMSPKHVQSVSIICGGIGYTANATLALSDNNTGTPAPGAEILAYTDANGSIYKVKIMSQGNYTTTPTITVPSPGSGYGAIFQVTLASSIASVSISAPGSGYQSTPTFQFGSALSEINVTAPGSLYQVGVPITVTISPPDDLVHGVQATAVAKLGGTVTRVNVVSAGSGYTNPAAVTISVVSIPAGNNTATFVPIFQNASLLSVEITNPGDSYATPPVLTLNNHGSPGSGAVLNCELGGVGSIAVITLTNPGNGYVDPPSVLLSAPVDGSSNPILNATTAQAMAVLAAGPVSAEVILAGMGGSRITQATVLAQGNNLQVTDFHDDNDSPGAAFPEPQSSSVFYYNIKADPIMALRYPPNPIDKASAVCNGVELLTRPYNTATGGYSDPDTDVGISTKTPFWTTFDLDGSPWDRNWSQYVQELAITGNDAIIQNTGPVGYPDLWWRFWENVFKYAPSRNKGWLHINKASRFYQTNKITSLGVLAPLRLLDAASGVESSNDGSPMTGQLVLAVDAMDNFIGGTNIQIDMMLAGNAQPIYTNNTGVAVGISSVVMIVVFQSVASGNAQASNNTAQITIGTKGGGYRDYVGTINDTVANTWLSQTNQFKEFFPDQGVGAPIIQPGDSLWVNIVQPAGAPITAQLTVCKVKGFII